MYQQYKEIQALTLPCCKKRERYIKRFVSFGSCAALVNLVKDPADNIYVNISRLVFKLYQNNKFVAELVDRLKLQNILKIVKPGCCPVLRL